MILRGGSVPSRPIIIRARIRCVLINFSLGNGTRLTYVYGVRPAFHLDLNSVLFTSAAVGGKSSGAVGTDALKQVESYSGSEWKLTLKDDSRNSFSASVAAHSGNIAYIHYNGAAAGTMSIFPPLSQIQITPFNITGVSQNLQLLMDQQASTFLPCRPAIHSGYFPSSTTVIR